MTSSQDLPVVPRQGPVVTTTRAVADEEDDLTETRKSSRSRRWIGLTLLVLLGIAIWLTIRFLGKDNSSTLTNDSAISDTTTTTLDDLQVYLAPRTTVFSDAEVATWQSLTESYLLKTLPTDTFTSLQVQLQFQGIESRLLLEQMRPQNSPTEGPYLQIQFEVTLESSSSLTLPTKEDIISSLQTETNDDADALVSSYLESLQEAFEDLLESILIDLKEPTDPQGSSTQPSLLPTTPPTTTVTTTTTTEITVTSTTALPSASPTAATTEQIITPRPSPLPTLMPSQPPSMAPTTSQPAPTLLPTASTRQPSNSPTDVPTVILSVVSDPPTMAPTVTAITATPTTLAPTLLPTDTPTDAPTMESLPLTNFGGGFEILETVPHDTQAFTQGFELIEGSDPPQYWESTGLNGRSSLRRVDLTSGTVLQQVNLETQYFGEGMTQLDDERLIQLTWKAGVAFVYNAATFEVLEEISYRNTNGEGWGICKKDASDTLYVSDGSQYLHTWNATSLELTSKVEVYYATAQEQSSQPQNRINELEWDYHRSSVLANVWLTDWIVRIDPETGRITHRYDMSTLPPQSASANVLNGIAVTDQPNIVWVMGKLWSNAYKVRLLDNP